MDENPDKSMGVEMGMRCKQCNVPLTSVNIVDSPNGVFCSEGCRDKYTAFYTRAAQLNEMHKPFSLALMLKRAITKLGAILILLVGIGLTALLIEIPVLSDFARLVKEMLNF